MKKLFLLCVVLLVVVPYSLWGDRGSIPFKPHIKIFEPVQRAMIAWNGDEEILLLSTDLHASDSTKVLEVIPLPSEPEVKKGDVEVFRKATALINRKLYENALSMRTEGLSKGADRAKPPAGEVTFHKKIGAHDISVTHVLNDEGFIEWVEKYLKSKGVENPLIPDAMKSVISEYLDEEYSWFVFDVVELDDTPKTNQAIQYKFKSNYLYYPVKITRTEEGYTEIELLVLTSRLLSYFPGISIEDVELQHEPVTISSSELRELSEEMDDLLGNKEKMKLRIWKISGELSSFKEDLKAK
jgi:hypothetical protein